MIRNATLQLAMTILLISATHAFAQAPPVQPPTPAPAQPAPPDPKACAPGERLELEEDLPKEPVTTGRSIGEKLARTGGVLCPPTIDPEIRLRTPSGGTLTVINPPGTPDGDPSIQPK